MGDSNTNTTSTPVVTQQLNDFYAFYATDSSGNLKYTKYNFNFDKFLRDNISVFPPAPTLSMIWYYFAYLNGIDLKKAFTVKQELQKYFNTTDYSTHFFNHETYYVDNVAAIQKTALQNITNPTKIDIYYHFFLKYKDAVLKADPNNEFFKTLNSYVREPAGLTANQSIVTTITNYINSYETTKLPFTTLSEDDKYFTSMSKILNYLETNGNCFGLNYQYIVAQNTDATYYSTFENQFELIKYSNADVRRLQDYICYKENKMFTKYNFNFELYKNDFKLPFKNYLPIFTDYLVRIQNINGSVVPGYGFGYPTPEFEKYFIQTTTDASGNVVSNYTSLQKYLTENSVTSIYSRVTNSFPNIDWNAYISKNIDLNYKTMQQLREHFLLNGQFERRTVPFGDNNYNETLQKKVSTILKVTCDDKTGTGFLFDGGVNSDVYGKKQLYLVTCYHLIKGSPNQNTIMASVNYVDNSNIEKPVPICTTLQFKIIGFDMFSDVLVGLYDEKLDYNKTFNSTLDINKTPTLAIDGMSYIRKNEEVYTIGNIGTFDSNSILSGKLMNNSYNGDYNSTFYLGSPGSYLIQFNSEKGLSGAPIFKKNTNECIGMINGSVGENGKYTVSISNFYLSAIVNNSIARWYSYGPYYENLKDYSSLNFFTGDSYPKKWFGVLCKYYNPFINYKWKSLSSLTYNSGLLVYEFILGFNKTTNTFITNPSDLNKTNVIKIDTFLLKSQMYQKFIENNRNPIVIKSVLGFQNVESDYDKFSFGLENNQYGYRTITYNTAQIKTIANEPGFTNATLRIYPLLSITYFYFDGSKWIETTEVIGGDTAEWYNVYENDSGKKMKQHKLEFPLTLIPFTRSYIFGIGKVQSNNKSLISPINQHTTDSDMMDNTSDVSDSGVPVTFSFSGGINQSGRASMGY